MKTGSMIAGTMLFGLGIAIGYVLDHFTIWTGPKPNSLQLIGGLALVGIATATFLLGRRSDHGPET